MHSAIERRISPHYNPIPRQNTCYSQGGPEDMLIVFLQARRLKDPLPKRDVAIPPPVAEESNAARSK